MTQFLAAFTAGVVVTGTLVLALGGDAEGDNPDGSAETERAERIQDTDANGSKPAVTVNTAEHSRAPSPINAQADPSMDEETLLGELEGQMSRRSRQRTIERLGLVGTDAAVPVLAELAERGRPADRPNAIAALGAIATSKAVDMLIALSDSGPSSQKRTAIHALGRAGGDAATQWLRELVDTSAGLAPVALSALAEAAGEGAQEFLLERLRSGEPRLAVAAARAMSQLGTPEALEALLTVTRSSATQTVRTAAIRGLAGFDSPRARRVLEGLALGTATHEASAAVDALGEIGDAAAVKVLSKVALKGTPNARSTATYALAKIGDSLARDALIRVLAADDNYTMWAAARGLSDIFDEESIAALLKAVEGSTQRAQAALSALAGAPRDERVVAALKRLLDGVSSIQVKIQVLTALASMLRDDAIPLIEAMFETAPQNQLYALVSALTTIGTKASVQALRRILKTAPPNIQVQALQALINSGSFPKDELRELVLARLEQGVGYNAYSFADMLARIGGEASQVALMGMLKNVAPNHAGGIASAILNRGDETMVAGLLEFARNASDKRAKVLIGSMASSQKPAVREFLVGLAQGDTKEADDVLRSMAWNNPEALREIATAGVDSPRATRRAAAVQVLGRLNDAESLKTVVAAVSDDDQTVRQAALTALQSNQSKGATAAMIELYPNLKEGERGSLIYGLARTGKPEAIALIKQTLEDGGSDKYSAFHALMTNSSSSTLSYLKDMAEGDSEVAKFVAKQLQQQLGTEYKGGPN